MRKEVTIDGQKYIPQSEVDTIRKEVGLHYFREGYKYLRAINEKIVPYIVPYDELAEMTVVGAYENLIRKESQNLSSLNNSTEQPLSTPIPDNTVDWRILTCNTKGGQIHDFIPKDNKEHSTPCFEMEYPCHIYSVERGSDGVEFTIGDKIGWGMFHSYETTLTGFEIQDGRLKFNDSERPEHFKLSDFENAFKLHKKPSQPLPTVTDNPDTLTEESKAFYAARETSLNSNGYCKKYPTFSDYKQIKE